MSSNEPVIDDHGRLEPEPAADEVSTLRGFLDYQRGTLKWKCTGVDAEGMRATTASSTMTLGGLLKHMAWVEDHWFSRWFHDRPTASYWADVDWKADQDWEWNSAADDTPEQLLDLWSAACDNSRACVAEALETGGLDQLSKQVWHDGRTPNLRWILVHMIEEYARHNGHADLLREAHDGGAIGE